MLLAKRELPTHPNCSQPAWKQACPAMVGDQCVSLLALQSSGKHAFKQLGCLAIQECAAMPIFMSAHGAEVACTATLMLGTADVQSETQQTTIIQSVLPITR